MGVTSIIHPMHMKRGNEQVVEKSIEYLVPGTNLVYENYYWYAIIFDLFELLNYG